MQLGQIVVYNSPVHGPMLVKVVEFVKGPYKQVIVETDTGEWIGVNQSSCKV